MKVNRQFTTWLLYYIINVIANEIPPFCFFLPQEAKDALFLCPLEFSIPDVKLNLIYQIIIECFIKKLDI